MTDPDRLTTHPKSLDDFVGQRAIRDNLRLPIDAAKRRGDVLNHVLLFRWPGLRKGTK